MENENKLPLEFKAKWVEALRSGDYPQGRFNLYSEGAYCCMGVAGIINGLTHDQMKNKSCYADKIYSEVTPIPLSDDQMEVLTGMNDDGNDFFVIADYIEENL